MQPIALRLVYILLPRILSNLSSLLSSALASSKSICLDLGSRVKNRLRHSTYKSLANCIVTGLL